MVRMETTLSDAPGYAAGDYWGPPVVSGDGRWVAYTDDTSASSHVGRIEVATGQSAVVATGGAWGPDLSYDGSRMAYLVLDSATSEYAVWLWDAVSGHQRLSEPGAVLSVFRRSVQISDDGRTVVWTQEVGGDDQLVVWTNGVRSTHDTGLVGHTLTGDGASVLGRDSQLRLVRYRPASRSSSVVRSTYLDFLAVSDDGTRLVGSGYTDEPAAGLVGWMSSFEEVAGATRFVVAHPRTTATPVASRLSGDGSIMVVLGSDARSNVVIDTASMVRKTLDVEGTVVDVSDSGRYALVISERRLSVIDLGVEAAPEVVVADLARSQLSDQIERLYLAVLGRTPDEQGLLHWTKARAGGATLRDIAASFSGAAEFENRYGDVTNGAFVDLLYQNVLNRAADAEGRAFWLGLLDGGTPRADLIVEFSESAEMINRTATSAPQPATANRVWRLYRAYFVRSADQAGLDYWHRLHWEGLPIETISAQFSASTEFQNRYGSLDDGQFIDLVYLNVLGRSADAEGRTFWLGQLGGGVSRGTVMVQFSESPEFVRITDSMP